MKSFQHFLIMDKGWEVRTKYKIKPKINNNKLKKKGPKIAHITFIFQTWFSTHTHTHTQQQKKKQTKKQLILHTNILVALWSLLLFHI